ncbi:MAG: hypothetical protein AB1513_03295 [Pseudomonadota bacterium]
MKLRIHSNQVGLFAMLLLSGAAYAQLPDDGEAPQHHDFKVTSDLKDASHPYYNQGSPEGFVVDGVQGKTLVVVRGKTYTFGIDTGVMHDFYLSTKPKGWGGSVLTAGVDHNFTYKGTTTFRPSAETQNEVYYACRNHQYMGGKIMVVNPGEEGKAQAAIEAEIKERKERQAQGATP